MALPRRVGVVDAHRAAADPAVRHLVRGRLDQLADAGVEVEPCRWPGIDRSAATSTLILLAEAAAVHRVAFASAPDRFAADVRRLLEAAHRIDAPSVAAALQRVGRAGRRSKVALAVTGASPAPRAGGPA